MRTRRTDYIALPLVHGSIIRKYVIKILANSFPGLWVTWIASWTQRCLHPIGGCRQRIQVGVCGHFIKLHQDWRQQGTNSGLTASQEILSLLCADNTMHSFMNSSWSSPGMTPMAFLVASRGTFFHLNPGWRTCHIPLFCNYHLLTGNSRSVKTVFNGDNIELRIAM
jgi:hypothetical protein